MDDLIRTLTTLAKETPLEKALHALDVLIVAYIIYRILALVKGTKALRLVIGVIVVYLVLLLVSSTSAFHLDTLHWMLEKAAILAPVALVILFLPELRQALERVGKLGSWTEKLVTGEEPSIEAQTIEEVVAAAAEMSANKTGALVVLEKTSPLSEIISTGVQLEARVSAALLGSIFYEGNPLHDGAAVVRGSSVVAGACRLPLSESKLDANMHMRHRAAIGLTEQTDAIVVVVSEERGSISIASEGTIQRLGGPSELRDVLKRQIHERPTKRSNGQRKKMFTKSKPKVKSQ